jgi:tetratricopeptide (TPR) repeat protein
MPGKRDVFDQAMSRGHSAAWDQQWEKAIACYRAALTEFPDDPNALTSLGFAMFQADRPEEALKVYQRAASLAPGEPVAPEKCGEIFERLGRLNEAAQTYMVVAEIHLTRRDVQKAIDNWNRVTRLTPDNLNAHSRLALAYEHSGKTRPAVIEYLEVARIFQRANDSNKAAQAAQRAMQLDPRSTEARDALEKLRRGIALPVPERPKGTGMLATAGTGPMTPPPVEPVASKGTSFLRAIESFFTPPEAEADADGAAGGRPASPIGTAQEAALSQLAEMLFEEDADTTKTSGSLSGLMGSGRGDKERRAQAIMYLGQAISHHTNNESEEAANNYRSAIESGLDHPLVNFALGILCLDLDQLDDAVQYLRLSVGRQDVGLGAFFALGEAFRRQGRMQEALASLLEALKRLDMQLVPSQKHDALAEAYESLTESLTRVSDEDRAKLIPNVLQFLSGDGWEERARQARKSLDATDDGKVTPLADMLATPGTDRVLDAMRRIENLARQKLWATAMEEAFYAIQFSPTYLPIHIRMAEILVAENKYDSAAAKYGVIADAYRIRGEHMRAARILQEVLRMTPLDVKTHAELIDILVEQGRVEEALKQYLELADTYYQLADLDATRAVYADGLELAQRSRVDRTWQVKLLHRLGDMDMQRLALRDALPLYEQIRNLAPDDAKARGTLIELYFRLGNPRGAVSELDAHLKQLLAKRDFAQATTLLEELVSSYPEDTALIARLARLFQDQGRKAEAIAQYDRLGEIQLNAGQNTQAAETIRTIIALGPDNPAVYQKLLAQIQR